MENKAEKIIIRAPLFIVAAMLQSAAVAAAKKSNRVILTAVNLSSDDDGQTLEAIATDSARLNRIVYDLKADADTNGKSQIYTSGNFSLNLTSGDISKIASAQKESEKLEKKDKYTFLDYQRFVMIESDGEKVTLSIQNDNGETLSSFALETVAGDYPVNKNMFPKNNGAFISFNPGYVGDIQKAAKLLKCDGDAVIMQAPAAPMRPFSIEYQSGIKNLNASALITPMRADGEFKGFEYLTKGGADLIAAKNLLEEIKGINARLQEENAALKKQLAEQPAAGIVTLESVKKAYDQKLIELTAAIREKETLSARIAELEEKNKAAAATIHEKNDENIKLVSKIKELEKTLEEAENAAAPADKKDGGKQPATERQRAYIAKLGGMLPEGATIRDASILITQLKKNRVIAAA